ncbi:hypothetical protein GALL_205230 [mine drainage metagenome]|uniref:Uncharacterized protein n=1 Tax=mine drainage metagenome TaxID=410659 RepID=A0A1J5RP49_9ZZZZ
MKVGKFLLVLVLLIGTKTLVAQERVDHQKMNYLFNPKQNSILYNDTLYKGSNQFKALFLSSDDKDLIRLYHQHQTAKIVGNISFTVGTLGIVFASSNNSISSGTKWGVIGGGVFCMIAGTLNIVRAQSAMQKAVYLFNKKHSKATVDIDVSGNNAGLVVNF